MKYVPCSLWLPSLSNVRFLLTMHNYRLPICIAFVFSVNWDSFAPRGNLAMLR